MIRTLPVLVAALLAAPSAWTSGPAAQVAAPGQVTPPRGVGPASAAPTGTGVIRGAVVAMDTGTPLRRVQVRAYSNSPDARGTRTTSTDDQGRFELRELAAGRYTISASKGGFVTLQFGQRRPSERGTPVDLADGQVVEKVAIALPRGGVITGRISDDAGEPAAGVRVQVMRYMFMQGGRRLMPGGRDDQTDDQGAFRIYGLPPGDYYVAAAPAAVPAMMPDARLATGDSDQGFAPTYYPGTPSVGDAQRISLAVGQEVDGISFGLTPTRLSRISGRVIGLPSGSGIGFVSAVPEDGAGPMGMSGPPGQIQPDGEFEMRGLPPGRYVLQVLPRGPQSGDMLIGMTSITVAGVDLANVTIAMQRPGTISGRVEFDGGAPAGVRASQVRLMPTPADPRTSVRIMFGGPPEIADDFTFRVSGATVPMLLRASGPSGWFLKAVEIDGEDHSDQPIRVGPGSQIAGVRVVFTQSVTTVSGSVRDDRGAVVLDATVLVFPDDEARWAFSSRHIRTTRPDTEGRFELTGLPPSPAYRIVALTTLEDGQAYDPEFLASVRDRADRLALVEGETKAIELRLRP